MSQYKVVTEFELDGAVQAVDSVVELSEEAAAPLVEAGTVVAVEAPASEQAPEEAPAA